MRDRQAVFNEVWEESSNRKGYSVKVHRRVDDLVSVWLISPRGASMARSGTQEEFESQVAECDKFVQRQYKQVFVLFFLWPVISGLISWLVQRIMVRLYGDMYGVAP